MAAPAATHVLTPAELARVELVLAGWLGPDERLGITGPAELHDQEGVTVATVDAGGRLAAVSGLTHHDFLDLRRTAPQLREEVTRRGWPRVLAYAPTEPVAQEQLYAVAAVARKLDAGVLLLPLHGPHSPGDLAWYARTRTHLVTRDLIAEDLGADRVLLALVPAPEDGARVGRLAASAGATHLAVDAHEQVVAGPVEIVRLPDRDTATLPTASAAEIARVNAPRDKRGLVIFLTGLSGSGKSTVARALAARLMELGGRRVTLLDGDVVRRMLSSELTFSREHRDLNISRIGWVAAEIAKHGGVALCAPIAPYDATRRAARAMAEGVGGGFVLVHVATPLEVCEARDRKGLYAKARAGELTGFTGIDDPYEPPADAELRLDTSAGTADDAAERILAFLQDEGWITP